MRRVRERVKVGQPWLVFCKETKDKHDERREVPIADEADKGTDRWRERRGGSTVERQRSHP